MSDERVNTVSEVHTPPDKLVVAVELPDFRPETAFEYWINPDLLRAWWPPQAEVDGRPGGAYHFSWPSMNWHLRGRYSRFEPGRELEFTWRWDHEPEAPEYVVSVQLEAVGKRRRVELTHGPYEDSDRGRTARDSHLQGWRHFLGKLEEIGQGGEEP